MNIEPQHAQPKLKFKIELTENSKCPRILLEEVDVCENGFLCPAIRLESFKVFLEAREIEITQLSIFADSEGTGAMYFLNIRSHSTQLEMGKLVQYFNGSLR